MTLAQRVKDQRYAKGWGPDELAAKAEISRTALYQIESGRTELPRAGTLRRIAAALEVSTEALLAPDSTGPAVPASRFGSSTPAVAGSVEDRDHAHRFQVESSNPPRNRDLDRKFHELLASPLGEGVARIVEESYRILPHSARPAW